MENQKIQLYPSFDRLGISDHMNRILYLCIHLANRILRMEHEDPLSFNFWFIHSFMTFCSNEHIFISFDV